LAIDYPLRKARKPTPLKLLLDRKQDELLPGLDAASKNTIIDASKSKKLCALELLPVLIQHAADLRSRLNHDDAGEQWSSGHMAGHPEFVVTDFLDSDGPCARVIDPDHAVDLPHVATLWEQAVKLLLREEGSGKVMPGDVEEWFSHDVGPA
jgi:hypothetical protein